MHPADPDDHGAPAKSVLSDSLERRVTVGHIYEVMIGANGVCKLGDADMRIPGAHKGERYRVRVLALGVNQWTGRMEATVQKLDGPL